MPRGACTSTVTEKVSPRRNCLRGANFYSRRPCRADAPRWSGALVCADAGACFGDCGCEAGGLIDAAARESPAGALTDADGASEERSPEGQKCISAPIAARRSASAASRFMELQNGVLLCES